MKSTSNKHLILKSTVLDDEMYSIIVNDGNGIIVDKVLLMKAFNDMHVNDYRDRLIVLDCLRKGMILAQCKILDQEEGE